MARYIHRLTARIVPSPYGGENLALLVDDEPLAVLLDRVAPGHDLRGLVPTLLGCDDPADARLVFTRFMLRPGDAKVVPILMCPDDCDFGCTTVVVDALATEEAVEWRRLGIDATPWRADPERVGEVVDWFDGVGPFHFSRADYESAVHAFDDAMAVALEP